jgi:hypothetical protein
MSADEMKIEEALEYLAANGFDWSRKTLLNKSSGSSPEISKIRRGIKVTFRKSDLDAFIRSQTVKTHAHGVR